MENSKTNPGQNNQDVQKSALNDLPDSPEDEKRIRPEEVILDLPDVKDIPGQENIIPPKMNEFADTTIASDSDEGTAIFDQDDNEDDI